MIFHDFSIRWIGAAEDGLRVAAALAAEGTPPQVRAPKGSNDENCGPWHEEENVLAKGEITIGAF